MGLFFILWGVFWFVVNFTRALASDEIGWVVAFGIGALASIVCAVNGIALL